ncbi:MAG: response regulator transcription factor [Mogibacterium sp.]|nr:response regulator transcription factor [Mogibacterium sp.]
MNSKILIIEDDSDIREGIRIILESEGYIVSEASSGSEGLELLDKSTDLIILDIMMPGMNGIKTCEMIRKVSNVPILFLTAKSRESDKIQGLMAGGDDYMTKPFSYSELLVRITALLRRYRIYKGKAEIGEGEERKIERSGILINEDRNEVFKNGNEINLSDIEYGILLTLMKHPGRIFSAEELYEEVWKEDYLYSSNSTVMVHIRKLRVKIEDDPQEPSHIKTVWGKGYRFE